MANQLDRLTFGSLNYEAFSGYSLRNLDYFVGEFNVKLNWVFLKVEIVNDLRKSLGDIVEIFVVKFTIYRVHFCYFKVNYLDKIKRIGDIYQNLLLARLELFLLYFSLSLAGGVPFLLSRWPICFLLDFIL